VPCVAGIDVQLLASSRGARDCIGFAVGYFPPKPMDESFLLLFFKKEALA
jgi:hypothetical protein